MTECPVPVPGLPELSQEGACVLAICDVLGICDAEWEFFLRST